MPILYAVGVLTLPKPVPSLIIVLRRDRGADGRPSWPLSPFPDQLDNFQTEYPRKFRGATLWMDGKSPDAKAPLAILAAFLDVIWAKPGHNFLAGVMATGA